MVRKSPKTVGVTLRHAQGHSRVTNAVLLQHMQGMRSALETRIDGLEKRMGGLESRMTAGFTEVHGHLGKIDAALQRLYVHRMSMLGRIEKLEEIVGVA